MKSVAVMLVACLLVTAVARAGPATPAKEPVYSFGVVPQFEQRKLYAVWKPIVDALEQRTGLRFQLVTTLKIPDFEKAYYRGEFDFVYVNPYHVARLHGPQAYIPLAADQAPLRGIIVVRRDAPIHSPTELNGKTVAFPSANAVGSSLLVRADLEQIHHVQFEPLYVKTHSSVYLHVAKNLVAAGGGVEKTLREQDEALRSQLRVIYTTRACPSHPIAAHPRVPASVRELVRRELFALGDTPEGKAMLEQVPITRLVPVNYDDYAVMLGWGLEKYWQPIEP